MYSETITLLCQKLDRRIRRLVNVPESHAHAGFKQFWRFFSKEPLLVGILAQVGHEHADVVPQVERLLAADSGEGPLFEDEEKHAAFCYYLMQKTVERDDPSKWLRIARQYDRHPNWISIVVNVVVHPLVQYLQEQLDSQRATLAILRRYRKKCEWFSRERLIKVAGQDTAKAESLLKLDLYEYLHDQGIINFVVEPKTASGETDLLLQQQGENPVVAEAKIFSPGEGPGKSKGISHLASGLNQVYQAARDHEAACGYLAIYNMDERDLVVDVAAHEGFLPYIEHNHKPFYLLVIDLVPHEKPASKRGKLKPVVIREAQLVQYLPRSNEAANLRSA